VRPGVRELTQRFYYQRPCWVDGTSQFAALIHKRLSRDARILDLGAGRGKAGPVNFRGEAGVVVGVDPDWGLSENSSVDRHVLGLAQKLPFRAAAFDLVFSDWVVEHLPDPAGAITEVFRVLKPGGSLVFRTGNLFHYSYAIAAVTPHWFHRLVANWVRGVVDDGDDPHPTYYRMNTEASVRRSLEQAGFAEEELLMVEAEPSYLMFSVPTFLLGLAYERLVNRAAFLSGFRACIFGCFRKPE